MVKKLILSSIMAVGLCATCVGFVQAESLYSDGGFSKTVPSYMGTVQTDKKLRYDANNNYHYMTFEGKSVGTTINFAMLNMNGDQRSNSKTYGAGATDTEYTGVYDAVTIDGHGNWYRLQMNASSSSSSSSIGNITFFLFIFAR